MHLGQVLAGDPTFWLANILTGNSLKRMADNVKPVIQYLKINRRQKEAKRAQQVQVEFIDFYYPEYDDRTRRVIPLSDFDQATVVPLETLPFFNNVNTLYVPQVFDAIPYYRQQVYTTSIGETIVEYADHENWTWQTLDDSNFIEINLDTIKEEGGVLYYDFNRKKIIVKANLEEVYLFPNSFAYDFKSIAGIATTSTQQEFVFNYTDHEGYTNDLGDVYLRPFLELPAMTRKARKNRQVNAGFSTLKGQVYLYPLIIKKEFNTFVLKYVYVARRLAPKETVFEADVYEDPVLAMNVPQNGLEYNSAMVFRFTHVGALLEFLNQTIFYLDTIDFQGADKVKRVFLDRYRMFIDHRLYMAKNDIDELLELLYYVPAVFLQTLDRKLLWDIIGEALSGSLTNAGRNDEDIVLKLVKTVYAKEGSATVFLQKLLDYKTVAKVSYFYALFNKMNTANFIAYNNFLKSVWLQSDFANPDNPLYHGTLPKQNEADENEKAQLVYNGPLVLPYKSDKFIGFYYSNTEIEFVDNYTTLLMKYETGKYDTVGHRTIIKEIFDYTYHPLQPIGIINVAQKTALALDYKIPAFYLKAVEAKKTVANWQTGLEYTVDAITLLSGVGNIARFRHLAKLAQAASRLKRTQQAARFANTLATIRLGAGVIEIGSGTLNALLKLTGLKDTAFGKSLSEVLFWLEMFALTGELTTAIKRGLRRGAKKVLEKEDEIAELHKQIDNGDEEIISTLGGKNADEAKSQLNDITDSLKKVIDDVVEVFDVQKVLDDYVALRSKYINEFPDENAWYSLNRAYSNSVVSRDLQRRDLLKLYDYYINKHPELDGMNFAIFDTKIFRKGKLVENVKEFSHSKPVLFPKGERKVAEEIDGRVVIDKIDDQEFLKDVRDLKGARKINDSEIKYIYHFLTNHYQRGDYFVIEMENIFMTCTSCRKEFLMFKEFLGDKVKIIAKNKDEIIGTADLKDYLGIQD